MMAHGLNTSSMQSNNKAGFSIVGFLNKMARLHDGQRQFIMSNFYGKTRNILGLKIGASGFYNQQVNNYESARKRK